MRKVIIFIAVLVFLISLPPSYPQIDCGPTSFGCISAESCANAECVTAYNTCDGTATGECRSSEAACNSEYSTCSAGCTAAYGSCESECVAEKATCLSLAESTYVSAVGACQTEAKTLQETITKSGAYSAKVGCGELTSCVSIVDITKFSSFNRLQDCNGQITDEMKKKIIENHPAEKWQSFLQNTPENNALIKPGVQLSPNNLASRIQTGGLSDGVLTQTDASTLANEGVRAAMAEAGRELPWWKQIMVTSYVLKSNPYVQAAGFALGVGSFGKEIYDLFIAEDEEDQTTYNQNTYYGAQSDTNNAQNSQAHGTSQWTNCPGHRDGRCSGKDVCVTDSSSGSSQCIAALPGQHVTVRFGSIHIIDSQQKNMFTLTGAENQGVVYQQDGFVNIDKGGTTKISVTGNGALVTDAAGNQLYLGRGTTIYLGIGNQDIDTYITNALILHKKSGISAVAVNPVEQKFFANNRAININQNQELALTINKESLKLYRNAVDISENGPNYHIRATGSSNLILGGKNKFFPLMARNYAKGDSLVVKNKDVKVLNGYIIDDGMYKYSVKAVDESTKVFTQSNKIIEDSGALSKELTRRQSLLVYSAT